MNRNKTFIILVFLTVIGSIIVFNGTNLVIADIGNNAYGWNGLNVLASIPGFMFSIEIVALSIFIVRMYLNKEYRKRTMLLYIRIIIGLSITGILGTVFASIYSYDSIMSPYPFKYYLIVFLLIHSIIVISLLALYFKTKKRMPNDKSKKKITLSYVLFSIYISGFTYLAFNRFGAFLCSYKYVQLSTLHMTWFAYVWMLIPILLILYLIVRDLGYYKDYYTQIMHLILIACLNISFTISIVVTGTHNTLFISAISPAFGLDRLATFPYVGIVEFTVCLVFNLCLIIYCVYLKAKVK